MDKFGNDFNNDQWSDITNFEETAFLDKFKTKIAIEFDENFYDDNIQNIKRANDLYICGTYNGHEKRFEALKDGVKKVAEIYHWYKKKYSESVAIDCCKHAIKKKFGKNFYNDNIHDIEQAKKIYALIKNCEKYKEKFDGFEDNIKKATKIYDKFRTQYFDYICMIVKK